MGKIKTTGSSVGEEAKKPELSHTRLGTEIDATPSENGQCLFRHSHSSPRHVTEMCALLCHRHR